VIDSQLYVIVWGPFVRIGSAADPIDRLARVIENRPPRRVYGNPELIGSVPGGFGAESWLLAALLAHKAGAGWYHLRGPLLELVEAAARSGVEDLAPRTGRAPVRMRSGDAVFAVTSSRGEAGTRKRHALLLPEGTPSGLRLISPQPGLCGAGVSLVVGGFDGTDARACTECRRALPARRRA
jgi:hypothetical protein